MMNQRIPRAARVFLCCLLSLLLFGAAAAEGIAGSWTGKIYASKYGFTQSRSVSVVFSQDGKYSLKAASSASQGSYALNGDKITLTTSGGTVKTMRWSLKGSTLTMKGKMDLGGYSNVSCKMVVKKLRPKVSAVKCAKVPLGTASTVIVTGNDIADCVKLVDAQGTVLAKSDTPTAERVFQLRVTLPKLKNKLRVYAGHKNGAGEIEWGGAKKITLKTQKVK